MGVIAEGILRGCQGLFTPVSLGYPLSVFNKNSTLKQTKSLTNVCLEGNQQRVQNPMEINFVVSRMTGLSLTNVFPTSRGFSPEWGVLLD